MNTQPRSNSLSGTATHVLFGLTVAMATVAFAGRPSPANEKERSVSHVVGMPMEKPTGRPVSAATARLYDRWGPLGDYGNEFYTTFKYSRIGGIGKAPDVSRRDPSKVIRVGKTYYVWYTRRKTAHAPVGLQNYTDDTPDDVPAWDWDMADIYYATSRDGFNWTEQGVAVARNKGGDYADRSLSTPDILCVNKKCYLYYQAFTGRFSREKGDRCDVTMAWADSPDGPWTKMNRPIVELGGASEWDGGCIHDPYPLVYKGQIWLYYKSDVPLVQKPDPSAKAGGKSRKLRPLRRMHGVAMADRPEGPFVKSPLNPVANSGHETCLFPYREGMVSLIIKDGPEKNTVQYAPDGVNFEMKATVVQPPVAAGPFCPDAFAGNGDGRGICWGLSHIVGFGPGFLLRFDCNLHRDVNRSVLSRGTIQADEASHFQPRTTLPQGLRQRFMQEGASSREETVNTRLHSGTGGK
ncbi:MAG TPA: family 43 glycosylhydrolase [Thermoguttaceae bacterium]|nr:family 43 glycosylhydrolase [Thermoguttaceae bacterium]